MRLSVEYDCRVSYLHGDDRRCCHPYMSRLPLSPSECFTLCTLVHSAVNGKVLCQSKHICNCTVPIVQPMGLINHAWCAVQLTNLMVLVDIFCSIHYM